MSAYCFLHALSVEQGSQPDARQTRRDDQHTHVRPERQGDTAASEGGGLKRGREEGGDHHASARHK
jgi:hypothetical protein